MDRAFQTHYAISRLHARPAHRTDVGHNARTAPHIANGARTCDALTLGHRPQTHIKWVRSIDRSDRPTDRPTELNKKPTVRAMHNEFTMQKLHRRFIDSFVYKLMNRNSRWLHYTLVLALSCTHRHHSTRQQAAMVVWSRWSGDFYSLFLLPALERRSIISFSYIQLNGVRRAVPFGQRQRSGGRRKLHSRIYPYRTEKEAQVSLKPIVIMHMRADRVECTHCQYSLSVCCALASFAARVFLCIYVDICVGSMRCCCNPWMHFPNG